MELSPLVSVVLCTYNDEKFLSETIDSVLAQTFTDFEFIIWNDGSTDSTEKIVKSYHDNRIRYYYHENTGIGVARALATSEARGKYIAVIDGDDICFKERLQQQVSFLETHPKYVIVSSSVYYINEDGAIIGRSFPVTTNWAIKRMLKKADPIANPASMFLRDVYIKSGGYIGIRQKEDYFLFCRMGKFGKIKIISVPLIKYRVRQNSLSHYTESTEYDIILKYYRDKMINDEVIKDSDIELYNAIFFESRKEQIVKAVDSELKNGSIKGVIYNRMASMNPNSLLLKIAIFLKNFYTYLLY